MNRTIYLLSAMGALSGAAVTAGHATTFRASFDRADAFSGSHLGAVPQQGGGKGHGGGGGHQGGGGGAPGGHRAGPPAGGHQAAAHPSGQGRSGGDRASRARRNEPAVRVARTTGHGNRPTATPPRGAAAKTSNAGHGAVRAARLLAGAAALGRGRGLAADAVNVRTEGSRVRLLNRRGDVLIDMDENRYGEIGAWRLRRLGDQRPRGNAPSFCRSGDGHPVWGREWCVDKGFGLGSRSGTLWSRGSIDDVIFRRFDSGTRLDRGGLLGVLGDAVLGRLALQALGLGYDQPLAGVWVAQPQSPRLLRVYSGGYPVAEFVDRDYDNRPEVLYVVQPF
jgi:hypothetical protein